MAAVRVHVISGDPLARSGLVALLTDRPTVTVVENDPDVVVWDTSEPPDDLPRVKVPVLAVIADESQMPEARAAGARGVVFRTTGGDRLAAAVTAVLRGMTRRVWLVALAAKASAYAAWATHDPVFFWMICDYGSAMLGVAVFQVVRLRRGPAPGAVWILAGIGASIVAALVQQSGLSLHERFNHNDLYHVLQMGATALLYRGGRDLTEPLRPAS